MKISAFTKTFDGVTVLDFPGIELVPGKIYGIIGANGSGKSTFARVLAGIKPADKKSVPLGKSISLGYMPQKNYAFRKTTKANILLTNKDEARAMHLMDALQITHLSDKPANRLSGGETARMALARLMMKQFNLVILDEPTAAMDIETTLLAEQLMLDYVKETGCALILVTHSLSQAKRLADEILYFHKGKLLEAGLKEEVLELPKKEETKKFLEFYGV